MLLALYLLQSRGISAAACGLWATLSPDPVVAMRTDLQLTALNVGVLGMYIHGNADNSCTDSSSVRILSINQPVAIAQELSNFHGSELYKVCTAGFTVCTVPRLIPFYNPRQGAPRSSMLWVTPTPAWTAPAAAPGVGFTLAISRGTTDYISLTGSGYTFEIGIGLHRRCATRTQEFSGGTLSVTSSSLSVSISATSLAVYSVCMQVSHSFTVVAPWFPLSAALGHSVHNLALGTPTTNVEWSLSSPYARYGIPTVFVAKQDIVADGWQNFAIDTTHDVCSPTLAAMFSIADLTAFNATHVHATVSIPRPSDNPGGGHGILCGNRGVDHPWVLLSTKNTSFVSYCDKGSGVYPTITSSCASCAPNGSMPCHNNGVCGTFEQKSFYLSSVTCSCFQDFYGSSCQFHRIPQPITTPSNGTFIAARLKINVTSPTADTVVVTFGNGSTIQCSVFCTFSITVNTTISALTRHTNGSQCYGSVSSWFNVIPPTNTASSTVAVNLQGTRTLSDSSSSSISGSALRSISHSKTISSHLTTTKEGTATQQRAPTLLPPNTLTTPATLSYSLSSRQSQTKDATSETLPMPQPYVPMNVSPDTIGVRQGQVIEITSQLHGVNFTSNCALLVRVTHLSRTSHAQFIVPSTVPQCKVVHFKACRWGFQCGQRIFHSVSDYFRSSITELTPRLGSGSLAPVLVSGVDILLFVRILVGPFAVKLNGTNAQFPANRKVTCTSWTLDEVLFQTTDTPEDLAFVSHAMKFSRTDELIHHICRSGWANSSDFVATLSPSVALAGHPRILLHSTVFLEGSVLVNFSVAHQTQNPLLERLRSFHGACFCELDGYYSCVCPANSSVGTLEAVVSTTQHQWRSTLVYDVRQPSIAMTLLQNGTVATVIIEAASMNSVQLAIDVVQALVPVTVISSSSLCSSRSPLSLDCLTRSPDRAIESRHNWTFTIQAELRVSELFQGNISLRFWATAGEMTSAVAGGGNLAAVSASEIMVMRFSSRNSSRALTSSRAVFGFSSHDCNWTWVSAVCLYGVAMVTFAARFGVRFFMPRPSRPRGSALRSLIATSPWFGVFVPCHSACANYHTALWIATSSTLLGVTMSTSTAFDATSLHYPLWMSLNAFAVGACRVLLNVLFFWPKVQPERISCSAADYGIDVAGLGVQKSDALEFGASQPISRPAGDWAPKVGYVASSVICVGSMYLFLASSCGPQSVFLMCLSLLINVLFLEPLILTTIFIYRWMTSGDRIDHELHPVHD